MRTSPITIRALCGLAGVLALSHCATTRESAQDCKKASYSFCDSRVPRADASSSPAAQSAARDAYQQCLDTQLMACGLR
ncbi:MAG: hypothetical protein WCK73_01055 [Deltaproteobacteria bacterium]